MSGALLDRIFDPESSAPGRRCAVLLAVLREWGDPLTPPEIGELLGWGPWAVRQALDLLAAEGRAGTVRRGHWIADPSLADALTASR